MPRKSRKTEPGDGSHDLVVTTTCTACGHAEEQHAAEGFYKPCEVPGCECEDLAS